MTIPDKYKGKYFYHFTHIENLESILKNGFLCTNEKDKLAIDHTNIASENIQNRRSEMDVTCAPKEKVHDYVPFYFTTRNPMLLGLTNRKNIDQPFLMFFAISIEKLLENNVIFTDASANTDIPPNFYSDPKDLDKLDWDSINSKKWGCKNDEDRHRRMAEVLIHKKVPLDWIETIIVWNKGFKKEVKRVYESLKIRVPRIQYEPHNKNYFYFTKFQLDGRQNETLVTGPKLLKNLLKRVRKKVKTNRKKRKKFTYENLDDLLNAIQSDFCVIEELAGIYKLETINDVHKVNVSDHTLEVVENLNSNEYYNDLAEEDKKIVKLAAYLHDIGKGPASKWKNGKQPLYPDHPADSLRMLVRVLSHDIKDLSNSTIKKICKLVAYHDLLGDIVGRGRSKKELFSIIENESELNMLIALSIADTQAINVDWHANLELELPEIFKEVIQNLE